jgi:hypothetical protein
VRSGDRKHKVIIQRQGALVDDGYTTSPGAYENYTTQRAAIFWGNGREQREAAQEVGSQPASFEVPSNSKTRAISVTDRLCYPVTDLDPANWPAWDIQAVSDLGFNVGVRITATRAAS